MKKLIFLMLALCGCTFGNEEHEAVQADTIEWSDCECDSVLCDSLFVGDTDFGV